MTDKTRLLRSLVLRFSGKKLIGTLRLTLRAFVNDPLSLLVTLGAIVATNFLVCLTWDCDVGIQTGWGFVREHVVPGLGVGFTLVFLWHLFWLDSAKK